MTIDEWKKFLIDAKLQIEQFNERDAILTFNYSMMT